MNGYMHPGKSDFDIAQEDLSSLAFSNYHNLKKDSIFQNMDIEIVEDEIEPKRIPIVSKKGKKILRVVESLLAVVVIVCVIKIVLYQKESYAIKEINQDIYNEVINTGSVDEFNVNFKKLNSINEDAKGWIKVLGTNIDYPVVQTNDNDYYLTHNIKNEKTSVGSIFFDYRNSLDGTDKNIIIYGHSRLDESMFGSLKNVLKSEWLSKDENRYITLTLPDGVRKYQVFSVYKISVEDYYLTTDFSNTPYLGFLATIKGRSIYDFPIELDEESKILTLSTCGDDASNRIVLHAKLI